MRISLVSLALLLLTTACSDDGPPTDDDFFLIEGTWSGPVEIAPGDSIDVTFDLLQDETDVFGTFTTSTGRVADVLGTLNGRHFTADFTFTDECLGDGSTTADLVNGDLTLRGTFTDVTDVICEGLGVVEFELDKQ